MKGFLKTWYQYLCVILFGLRVEVNFFITDNSHNNIENQSTTIFMSLPSSLLSYLILTIILLEKYDITTLRMKPKV